MFLVRITVDCAFDSPTTFAPAVAVIISPALRVTVEFYQHGVVNIRAIQTETLASLCDGASVTAIRRKSARFLRQPPGVTIWM